MSGGPTRGARETVEWKPRPVLAAAMRVLLFVAPIGMTFVVMELVGPVLYRPRDFLGLIVWFVQAAVVGTVALGASMRLARRALPVVSLLNMSLVFPDQAPSRFGTALRTGTLKRAKARAAEIGDRGIAMSTVSEDIIDLVTALGRHDRLTRGHTERVRAYSDLIGEELGLSTVDRDKLRWAVMLHDIGKLSVPYDILNKESKLTDDEWEVLKGHPAKGEEAVAPLEPWLGEWRLAAGQHHERWDGGGYPLGLKGTEITLAGRIVAVADAYDVITSARSYKTAMSAESARQELVRCSGGQFDPSVVKAFLSVSVRKVRPVLGPLAWLAEFPGMAPVATTSFAGAVTSVASAALVTTAAIVGPGPVGQVPDSLAFSDPVPAVSVADVSVTAPLPLTSDSSVTVPVARETAATSDTTTTLPTPVAAQAVAVEATSSASTPSAPAPSVPTTSVATGSVPTTSAPPGSSSTTSTTSSTPSATTTTAPTTTTIPPTTAAPTTTAAATSCALAQSGSKNLSGLDLRGCNLDGVNLVGADLSSSNLTGASLVGTNLNGANLRSSTVRSANLTNANLNGSDLRWSSLRDSNLTGTNIANANATFMSFYNASGTPSGYATASFFSTMCPNGNVVVSSCW